MPIPQLPGVVTDPSNTNINDLVSAMRDYVIRLERELTFMMQNGLDSTNMFEAGGWRVGPDSLASISGHVGMSSAGTDPTSPRFWAGDLLTGSPPWEVTEGGVMTAVGAIIKSSNSYPRIEVNGQTGLITIYYSATQYIQLIPDSSGQPEIYFQNGTSVTGSIGPTPTALSISTPAAKGDISISAGQELDLAAQGAINLVPTGNLEINGTSGYSGTIQYVKDVVSGSPTFGYITVTKGIITGIS